MTTGVLPDVAPLLRCPACTSPLEAKPTGVVCIGVGQHEIPIEDGVLVLACPEAGKYDSEYAARYAALWAFGYATLHSGLDEPVYRTVSSFVAEALASCAVPRPLIVDAGCGVGRVTGDCLRLHPRASVIALDASPDMLAFARRIVAGTEGIDVELPQYGFHLLRIPAGGHSRAVFLRADVESLPLGDEAVDVVLSVNIVDRLPHGPERAVRECHRVLKRGGTLVFTNPMNWTARWLWRRYPDAASLLELVGNVGFGVGAWFDQLMYRELLDGRGSVEEFRTIAIAATRE